MVRTTYTFTGNRPGGRMPHVSLHLPPEWASDALCAQTDPEAFYPDKGGNPEPARGVCAACPVRRECRDYALTNAEPHGVWGGLTSTERRLLHRRARRIGIPVTEVAEVGREAA